MTGRYMVRVWALCFFGFIAVTATSWAQDDRKNIRLSRLGTYGSGVFTGDTVGNPNELPGSEIAAYDPKTKRLFITNAFEQTIDIVSIRNPSAPSLVKQIDITPYGTFANSVAVHDGIVAVAVEASPKTANGKAVFFDTSGTFLAAVTVGALPDMLTYTPDGKRVLVANEGEPNSYGLPDSVDPEGSVSIIRLPQRVKDLTQGDVRTARFTGFNGGFGDPSIRIFGPGASVAKDLEPEYIAVSDDSKTAWVTLQENNAIAELNIQNGVFTKVVGLGFKDHSMSDAGLDGSDEDGPGTGAGARKLHIAEWPVMGMYLPDAIATFRVRGRTYLVTANEGDVRDWPGFTGGTGESSRLSALTLAAGLCPTCNDDVDGIRRLTVSKIGANTNADPAVEKLFAYGARSFSIWTDDGDRVFDSGDAFEQITATALPLQFNSNHTTNGSFDTRSDDKGPEPEGITVEKLWDRWYAFIALERIGGIMVYDVTDPRRPRFVQYINNRDFTGDPAAGTAGDLGPEASFVIPRTDSPTNDPLLVVPNEVSGTTTIFKITRSR